MWSGGGDLEGRLFGGNPAPREAARHLWGSGSLSEAAVDLSLARANQAQPHPHQANSSPEGKGKGAELSEVATPSVAAEEMKAVATETEPEVVDLLPTTTTQLDLRDYTSVKEVLLEMTNRKNGHTKLPPARWSIIKKESDHSTLKASKYNGDDKKVAFPRPTALVNPFPADIIPLNGNAQVWVQSKSIDLTPASKDVSKSCSTTKTVKQPLRHKVQKNGNGRSEQSKKKQLNTIVAQLTGSLKSGNAAQLIQADPSILHKLLTPADSVSFLSAHRLSGGEVAIQEQKDRLTEPDSSVVDRLKRLGTVIEVEDPPEPNALKMLEKITKSVSPKAVEETSKVQNQAVVMQQSCQQPIPTLYISKDVTLIPKIAQEPVPSVHEKVEPSLLEPVIDIYEEENILSHDGTFLFKIDSYHNVDLPNAQKVFSCDICSAVYSHSNMLRKHYLRLHISRKYISEKDMETFNIDHENVVEKKKEKLIFRCHTCRECFSNKNDLRSHLTDHPPVNDLIKQANKTHPSYKCENCSAVFKWRKQFGKHKKSCKPAPMPAPSPPPPPPLPLSAANDNKPDLFHCLYCNETFLNANTKRNHILSNHPYVRRKHYCVFCKKDAFTNNINLFSHLITDHPTVYFGCQVCKERYTNLDELKSHVNKRHENDERLKLSVMDRTSTIDQEKEFYTCETCQRRFLIENSFKEHVCFPEKIEKPKPKLQKIKKKVYPVSERIEKNNLRNVDVETLFYSRVAGNVRDNLLNHLDGKIYTVEASEDDKNDGSDYPSTGQARTLNFSAGFSSSSELNTDNEGNEIPARSKAQWEKYTFPKNYDGRCGLTSYIKDTSYLDISTQLIMRRNLQRLNMLPMREAQPEDVPSVLALERLGAECAESFGQIKKDKDNGEESPELGSLSGEWVRERMYVCSACRWETPCLWTMEDHKYVHHPRVHCPQHELIGEQAALSKTIYKRLIDLPTPFEEVPSPPTPPPVSSVSCTKCSKSGFEDQAELHLHILECAGVVLEPIGPSSSRRRRRRTRRRPRRGLKRNIPSTPQKPPSKPRTKPGDTDTIQRMIANLPPKRVSRKVFSSYEDDKLKNKNKNGNDKNRGKKKSSNGNRSESEPPTPTKDERMQVQVMLQKPTVIKKEQDYIDTSAEGGDVLSSLRMMPVRCIKPPCEVIDNKVPNEGKDPSPSSQADEKEMPKLEIEKDLSPVESAEIPVLSPVERKDENKKEKEDLICGISFVDGVIKYETVASVSEETQKLEISRKRKGSSSSANISHEPKTKKVKQDKPVLTRSQIKGKAANKKNNQKKSKDNESPLTNKNEDNKRRGRPKGSLTKKFSTVGSRRSNRISKDNSILKFDEILPCYEEDEVVTKKPEKPKRKPRKSKNDESIKADSTIIVVKAEIHPEPVNKRKLTEIRNDEEKSNALETTPKKLKEETDETKKGSLSDALDVYTFVEEITEIDLISSPSKGTKNDTSLKRAAVIQTKNHVDKSINENCEEETQLIDSSIQIDVNNSITEPIDNISEEVDDVSIIDDNKNPVTDLEDVTGNSRKITEENEVTSTSVNINLNDALDSSSQSVDEVKSEPINDTTTDSEENTTMKVDKSNCGTDDVVDNEYSSFNIEEDLTVETIRKTVMKKKKAKKVSKSKKKATATKDEPLPCQSELEKTEKTKTEKLSTLDKADCLEKTTKVKKTKKQLKKDKESLELELKRPKKVFKKKKVIKKIVKLKKRRPSKSLLEVSNGGEVLKIAGFKWEVSELETPTIKEEVVLEEENPIISSPRTEVIIESSNPTEVVTTMAPTGTQSTASAVPISQPLPQQSSSSASSTIASWESPNPTLWESQVADPGLGTILDSVNKLLNEPESTYTPLGLPSYSLADLQKAMGASDDEMAVLQQLGEASLQISSSDGSCSITMKTESEEWNSEKCIMDLDTQSTAPRVNAALLPNTSQGLCSSTNQLNHLKDYPLDPLLKDKEESTPNSLLAAHQGKEVLCPSCSCHFMGFPALQQHLAKAHPAVGPKAKPKRGGPTSSKIDLNRRMPLDSSQGPRLICFDCQQILPSDRMPIHLEQEHSLSADDVSKCSSLSGESNDGPVIGERLKSKMSSALGDLLDRAVTNLLTAKHKPNNSVFRLQGARELFSKFHTQKDGSIDEEIKIATPCKPYSCSICGQKFSLPSSRNKHQVLAHRSLSRVSSTPEPYETEEYENDWREAPSPPEVNGDNGSENTISPLCSDCGLSFDSIQEMMRHRLEDHTIRRSSVDTSTLSGCCPSPVPSSGGSHSLPDSEAEDSASGGKKRKSTRSSRLGTQQAQAVSRSVKERAEAALRELNLPRQRAADKRWVPSCNSKQKTDIHSFTDESL